MALTHDLDLAALIADTEAEILRLVGDHDPSTRGVYEMVRYQLGLDGTDAHAGNVHFPPNAYCHYQYDRDHPVLSDADDWASFPNLTGRQTVVNASSWGGTQRGFLIWWLGRFPRNPGSSQGVQNDWWRYVFPPGR